ncbi:MAG: hypothetical protein KDJ50_07750 [Alphaproteobacteria bacterium]|nr:hypothetical protein [Alphaproteobacteria bacterium]
MAGWSEQQIQDWYKDQPVVPSRDYVLTLVPRIKDLDQREGFKIYQYGSASYSSRDAKSGVIKNVTHDLYCVLIGDFDVSKPTYIIIGGTHGYEKGGPLAALGFAEDEAASLMNQSNFIVYPCLCPGPYEKELRCTEGRIDPNRDAFPEGAKSQEMQAFAESLKQLHSRIFRGSLTRKFTAAIDLHETPKKDVEINRENAEAGGEIFALDVFPEGLFLIAFDKDMLFADHIIRSVIKEGCHVVSDEFIYDVPNHNGVMLMSEMGKPTGRVRQLTALYTEANFTTEFCGMEIDDTMSDDIRAEPQRAAIRGLLSYSF